MQIQALQGTRCRVNSFSGRGKSSAETDFTSLLQERDSRAERKTNTEKESLSFSGKKLENMTEKEENIWDHEVKAEPETGEKKDQYPLEQILAFAVGQFVPVPALTGEAGGLSVEDSLGLKGEIVSCRQDLTALAAEEQMNHPAAYEVFLEKDSLAGYSGENRTREKELDLTAEQGNGKQLSIPKESESLSLEECTVVEKKENGTGWETGRSLRDSDKNGSGNERESSSTAASLAEAMTFSESPGQAVKQDLHSEQTGNPGLEQDHLSYIEGRFRLKTNETLLTQDTASLLASHFPAKGGTMEVELEPAYMGRLTIRVAFEGGKTAVTVLASDQRTLDILSQNVGQIAQILEERTGQQTVVYMPDQAESGQSGQEKQPDHQNRQENGRREKGREQDSFAQQLRLGLV